MAAPVLTPRPPAPPPAPPPPAAPPPAAEARRGPRARTAVAVTLAALLLTALLNADELDRRAHQMQFGWQRDAATAVTSAVHQVSHALLLDRPREALDRLFGHDRSAAAPVPTGAPIPVVPRRPTAADPLRLYVGGDSVAKVFGQSLQRIADATGVVDATVEFRYSTGLTRPDYYDWPGHLRGVLGQSPRPEVVVVLFGANDMQPIMTPTGVAGVGTDGWRREYARRVDALMTDLTRGGADVYWVGQPPMRSATLSARMAMVDRIFAAQAARHPDVTFVDAWPVFASTDGGFTADLPDASGHLVRVRDDDGVHLTPAGGDLLARATLQAVSARWPLPTR